MVNQFHMKNILIIILAILIAFPAAAGNNKQRNRLKVGLVLGGGGAKGAAEVGVLKYIEKSGIPIDYIAGTSIGSIVGGLYSCGYRSADLDTMFCSQTWTTLLADRNMDYDKRLITKKNGVTYVLGFPVARNKKAKADGISTPGLVRGDSIVHLLNVMTRRPDSLSFNNLPIPFRCVAVDVRHMREVVIDRGILAEAMRSSMSIPGVFKPVERDSMLLVDGGVLNNLPVDVVRKMGADVVIAVDLTQNKRETRDKKMHKRKGLGLLLEWVRTRPDLIKYNQNIKDCDVYINPDLKGFDAASFNLEKIQQMIERGEKAGKKAESSLKKLKRRVMAGK